MQFILWIVKENKYLGLGAYSCTFICRPMFKLTLFKASGDEESEEESDIDLDAVFDVDKVTPEQTVALNVCGRSYGMAEDDFFE